jgi:glycosyltransferase involved in cell wall biosynthesis
MNKLRHLLLITDAWQPLINGVVRTLGHTVGYLESIGIEVTVVHPGIFRTMPLPGYREIRIALFPGQRLDQIMSGSDANAIHIATEGPLGWAARRYCLRKGLPFTTTYHTQFPEYVNLRTGLPLSFGYSIVRLFHKPASNTFVATQSMEDRLREKGFEHLHRWGRGVDTSLFRPGASKGHCIEGERPVAVFLGRVAIEKNIRAFLDMPFNGTKVVIGDGPDKKRLQDNYPDVKFAGYKTGKELACHIADADVMVFPSKTETFGVVMLESMACGVPVAAYPVTGPVDVIENGVNGCVDEDLQVAVKAALEVDAESCRRFAEKFSWENSANQFLSGLAIFDRSMVVDGDGENVLQAEVTKSSSC